MWVWLFPLVGQAQVPQGISFQGVARDASGLPIALSNVGIGIRILDAGSNIVFEENHLVTTDQYGLFKLVIGEGTLVSGTFSTIDWGSGQHQVQPLINGSATPAIPFQSVPYALNSASSSVWSQNGSDAYYTAGRVGIGTDNPATTLHLRNTPNVLWGDSLSGSGFKLIWYGAKGAMRFGYLNNPFGGYNYDRFWDYDSVGYYSFAAGQNARAKGFGSFAFGSFGWADGSGSVAFFGNARGNNSYTFGGSSKGRGSFTVEGTAEEEGGIAMYGYTGGRYGVSIGGGTTGLGASSAREDYAIAIGWNSDARGQASIALGPSDAYGYNSFSTGWVTEARGNYSSTFGYYTNSYPYASMALGRYNVITGDSARWVGTDPIFMIGDGTGSASRSNSFMIQKNGQTAIGYNAPTGMLQVSSALGSLNSGGLDLTHATLLLGTTTTGMAFDANQIETVGSALYLNFNSALDVYLAYGGGDVGIGTNAPSDKLQVDAAVGQDALRVRVGGTTRFRVHDNGGVSIGVNLNPPAAGLLVSGNVIPQTDNTASLGQNGNRWTAVWSANGVIQTSDLRFKQDIEAYQDGLAKVLQLQPVSYNWKDDPTHQRKVGLIAQEVKDIIPEVVATPQKEEDALGINYAEIVPVLIQAIQEQQQTIEQSQSEIQLLRQEVEALKARLDE